MSMLRAWLFGAALTAGALWPSSAPAQYSVGVGGVDVRVGRYGGGYGGYYGRGYRSNYYRPYRNYYSRPYYSQPRYYNARPYRGGYGYGYYYGSPGYSYYW